MRSFVRHITHRRLYATLRKAWYKIYAVRCRGDLLRLGQFHSTDKYAHGFLPIYASHFARLRRKRIRILEIGIGGYADPDVGGASLRMWKGYFPKAEIYGADIHPKFGVAERRIRTLMVDQASPDSLRMLGAELGPMDIIIDDGSHVNAQVIQTFKILLPILTHGGLYCVEDTQTSYWPEYGGGTEDSLEPCTTMDFFRQLCDVLNQEYWRTPYPPLLPFVGQLAGIHFYRNLVIAEKCQSRGGK